MIFGVNVMGNYRDNIKDEIAYFYTVIKNMDTRGKIEQSKIDGHELQIDDILYDNFLENFDVDKQVTEQSLLGWIELIENENLHNAVKSLSVEEKIFISYIVKDGRTQRELAQVYGISQKNVCTSFNRLISKIKKFLK